VTIIAPDQLEYNEELYSKLDPRDKEVLYRFFNAHCDSLDYRPITKHAFTQDELRKVLASELEEETERFLEYHLRLSDEGVRTDPAIEYIAEHFDLEEDGLDAENRFELLLLLYENDLLDQLDELIIRAKIRSYSATRTYVFDEELDLAGHESRIAEFHHEWNQEQDDPKAVLADIEFESDQLVVIKLYQEVGPQHPHTFAFRLDGEEEIPVEPELRQVSYQQLKTIRFQLDQKQGKTEIVFTNSFTGWRVTMNAFFESVFSIDDFLNNIEEQRSGVAEEIEEELIDSVEDQEDPVSRTREKIDELRSDAERRIDGLNLPHDRKNDLKDRIKTIEISGSEILDDQSIETQEFRLIATLEGLFDSVDGIEQGFREMIKQAKEDNQAFVLTINDRPVQFTNGTWKGLGPGSMPDRDQRALELFFSDDDG
jgi:hypothetical protein